MKTALKTLLLGIPVAFLIAIIFAVLQRFEVFENPMLNMSFRFSDVKIAEQFSKQEIQPEIKYLEFEGEKIRYLVLKSDPDFSFIVLIHGAPGSSTDYINYFKDSALSQKVNLISIDRPGYGYSNFGHSETSMENQAKALQYVLDHECRDKHIILAGHSYGGPIALRMAVDFPGTYNSILLLAPAIDPSNEKEIKIASLGTNYWTRWMVPPAMRVAADEKITHVSELEKLKPLLNSITIPVCHIHGTKDSLVPFTNVAFAETNLTNCPLEIIKLENTDHFLPWSHHELIVNKVLELCHQTDTTAN